MSILALVVAALITAFIFAVIDRGYVKQPFSWFLIALVVIMWLVVLAQLLGFGPLYLGRV